MKHFGALFMLLTCLLVACNQTPNVAKHQQTPEDVTKAFFQAMAAEAFPKAAALGTKQTEQQVKMFVTELGMVEAAERAEMLADLKFDLSSINCTEQEGRTICKLCCGTDSSQAEVEVVKMEDKWYVQHTLGEY